LADDHLTLADDEGQVTQQAELGRSRPPGRWLCRRKGMGGSETASILVSGQQVQSR
jgi:hypothetical protein